MAAPNNQDNTINDNNNNKPQDDNKTDPSAHLPLQYAWTLWHTAPATGGGWSDNYKQIAQFSTVCEFWRLFNNISPPSLLDPGSSYHLFKGKVKPAWEDKFNANGGSWAFRFGASNKRNQRNNSKDPSNKIEAANSANYAWYHSVLNMIGNNFNHSDHICGLVINIKKGGRGKIELWIKDANSKNNVMEIGHQFKEFCGAARKKNVDIEFQSFASQLNKNHSSRSSRIKL